MHCLTMGTNMDLISGPVSASRLRDCGPVTARYFRFPDAGRIADAAQELSIAAAAFDQPAIFAFRARRIGGAAGTSNFGRSIRAAGHSGSAGLAGGQQVATMLDVLAAIPDAAILPGDTRQPPTALAAAVFLQLHAWWRDDAIGGILLQFGNKG